MSATEFHRQRRMFAIVHDALHIARSGDSRSHAEWFIAKGWIAGTSCREFEKIVRGFVDDRGLFAYRSEGVGHEFSHRGVIGTLKRLLPEIARRLDLRYSTVIWLGAIPDREGSRWKGRVRVGTIEEVT